MPTLRISPHDQVCPDFATEAYNKAREGLINGNDGIDNTAVIVMLTQVWNTMNRAERVIWNRETCEEEEHKEERRAEAERTAEAQREREQPRTGTNMSRQSGLRN